VLEQRTLSSIFEDFESIVNIHARCESRGHEISDKAEREPLRHRDKDRGKEASRSTLSQDSIPSQWLHVSLLFQVDVSLIQ
jgi:hypothetical protein